MTDAPDKARIRVESPAVNPATGATVDGVALVWLDRPEVLNALDYRTLGELVEALERLDTDESVRCVVITGSGDRADGRTPTCRRPTTPSPGSRVGYRRGGSPRST